MKNKKTQVILFFLILFIISIIGLGYRYVSSPTPSLNDLDQVSSGKYIDYSEDQLSDDKQNVIFFYAKWCPSCQRQNSNLMEQEQDIPDDVLILRADYDKEDELKQKYGVTLQHTFVVVDEKGNFIEKWNALYQDYDLKGILTQLDNR